MKAVYFFKILCEWPKCPESFLLEIGTWDGYSGESANGMEVMTKLIATALDNGWGFEGPKWLCAFHKDKSSDEQKISPPVLDLVNTILGDKK